MSYFGPFSGEASEEKQFELLNYYYQSVLKEMGKCDRKVSELGGVAAFVL